MTSNTTTGAERRDTDPQDFRERADAGDPEAQYRMGLAYLERENLGRARRWLQRAVEAGYGDAAFELGRMHLEGVGVPPSPADALPWFARGAESGSAAAMCRLAEMKFTRRGTEVDEDAARDWLLASARAGHPAALRQLGLVYARLEPAETWQPRAFACLVQAARLGDALAMHAAGVRLTEGVGVDADPGAGRRWLAAAAAHGVYLSTRLAQPGEAPTAGDGERPPEISGFDWPRPRDATLERVSEDPPVHLIHGMLDPETCDYVMNYAAPFLQPARTVDPHTGRPVRTELRTNSQAAITGARLDIPMHLVERDLTHAAQASVKYAERLAVLRYETGEEYQPHVDYITNPHAADSQEDYRKHGQRLKTVFAYLNEVPAGGETEFPKLGVKVKPERGGGVMFRNVRPEGTPDRQTLHAGCPVVEGEKWLATLWIRERPLEFR